jgi:hypothetical protein
VIVDLLAGERRVRVPEAQVLLQRREAHREPSERRAKERLDERLRLGVLAAGDPQATSDQHGAGHALGVLGREVR